MRKVEASITRETLKTAHPKSLIAKVADVAQLVEQPIRNRQVSGSSPLVGSILSSTCGQFTETCCTSAARTILASSCFMASVTTLGTVLM